MAKKPKNKLLTWGFGIGTAIIMVFIMYLVIDVLHPAPNYSDYCDNRIDPQVNDFETDQTYYDECRANYNTAREQHNFLLFIVFSLVGFGLVVTSFFVDTLFIEVSTMLSGFILMITAFAQNFDNKPLALVSAIIILVLLIYTGKKKIKDF